MDHVPLSKVSEIQELSEVIQVSLALSPAGHLYLYTDSDSENKETLSPSMAEKIQSDFSVSDSVGLLRLGLAHFDVSLGDLIQFLQ